MGAVALAVAVGGTAHAASYVLDQSNTTPPLPDGTPYLRVTVADIGGTGSIGGDSLIQFTAQTVPGAFTTTGSFGIDSFGFNNPGGLSLSSSNFSLPNASWNVSIASIASSGITQDGYGKFGVVVDTNGAGNRLDSLTFSIDVAGDSVSSYFGQSSKNAGQGNAYYVAHVAGFTTSESVTSAWFGGGDGLTPPASVPEPTSLILIGSLAGLGLIARRRRG